MLREDKTARIERIERRKRRPWNTPEPGGYEFSVGKHTRSGVLARSYNSVRFQPGEERFFELQLTQPVRLMYGEAGTWWWYLNRFWKDTENLDAADVQALVLQRELKKQKTLERARADAFGGASVEVEEDASRPRREPIPESVRHEVWRRDGGACVDCGSRERLEFDHIIPVSKGGSNTARNLELRCETCNRQKGATI
jgi:hypothetical protein